MSAREAFLNMLRFQLRELRTERGFGITDGQIEEAILLMNDDPQFHGELLDFFEGHIEVFGENYGL